MAAINVKISDDQKDQSGGVLPSRDAIAGLAGKFSDALVRLQAVASSLLMPALSAEGLAAGRHLLPGVNYHLESCIFALTEIRLLPDCVEGLERFESALQALADRLTLAQAVLRDAGVLPRPEPDSEFAWRGENVTVAFTQPRPAAPGDWFVRITARTAAAEQRLEELPLALPPISGTSILAGSVYGRIVRSPLAGNGFTFLNGYSEFYLSRDDSPGADVNVPVSELAVVEAAVLRETGRE